MRYQSTAANCGPAALRNALLCHGISRSEAELEQMSGYIAANGTTPKGILKALALISKEHSAVAPAVISEARGPIAMLQLLETLRHGHVVICCVDSDEHWVVAFGLLGEGHNLRLHVSDSADTELVQHHTPQSFIERWKGLGRKPYYGIIV